MPLEYVSESTYLGMWIYSYSMNGIYHIDTMCAMLSRRLGILHKIKFSLPVGPLSMLYNVIVLPLFDYLV